MEHSPTQSATRKRGLSALIIKAMGLFTGVQGAQILCSLLRTKFVAIWLGTAGVGLFAMFNQVIETVGALSQMSLRTSVQPALAKAPSPALFARLCCVIRRWCTLLGLLGAVIMIAAAPWLSDITFGNTDYTWAFMVLSISVFCASITSGELALLQGARLLRRMAKASVWGAVAGLAVSIPLFYFFRIKSVVPTLSAMAIVTALVTKYFGYRNTQPFTPPTPRETLHEGADFVRLGLYMTASAFITLLVNYIFYAWLNRHAGTETVGVYQSGFTIVNKYMGLVFSAVALEYYPRLCRVTHSPARTSLFVSHEIIIALAVITPVAIALMGLDDWVLRLLYDSRFDAASTYLTLALAGTAFRAISWCMAFVILARGDGATYIVTETLSALASLGLNILLYNQMGLTGLGIAYVLWYALYTLIISVVYFGKYQQRLTPNALWLSLLTIILTLLSALLRHLGHRPLTLLLALLTLLLSALLLSRLLRTSD